jgi:pimeloyl-ACP methyl ester carboxylesterase
VLDVPPIAGVTHRDVQARGLRVHVAEAGEGPPLVVQHGWPQHWYAWHRVLPQLAEHGHVVCPDMRGFGWTDAPRSGYGKEDLADDLLAVCDALNIERFALAGHDWGGFVTFVAAVRAPERVSRLVMINTGHGFIKVDLRLLRAQVGFWYMPIIGTPGLGPALIRRGRMVRWVHPGGAPWSADEWEIYLAPIRDPARACATQQLYRRFVAREFGQALSGRWKRERLTVPTLFLTATPTASSAPTSSAATSPTSTTSASSSSTASGTS